MIRQLAVLGVIGLLVALPIAARDRPLAPAPHTRRIVIITPHGEAIRSEFTTAFRAWAARDKGLEVDIDWRTPGGTSEITRYLDDRFRAEFAIRFPQHRAELKTFNDAKSDSVARRAFLASDVGVGADLLFGGGEFAYRSHAAKGYLIDTDLLRDEPGWFGTVIPQTLGGETVYDPQGRYFGACFGVFGIAYGTDRLAELGLPAPRQWTDIAGPAWRGTLTLTDPTKSGAAATAFERILQQQMAAAAPDLDAGWRAGFTVIRRLVANARWITDSASKPTRDAVRGDCVAAMAIDFQAKAEAEYAERESRGATRMRFVVPAGGTSVSADPIAVFRGAPDAEVAKLFLRFVLSPEGQRLWSQRVGTPGGPVRYALRRFPVRRDLLGPEQRALRSDPDEDPFAIAGDFTFHPEWTGKSFLLIQALIKSLALDARDELIPAWNAICAAGGPEAVPEAWEQFTWLPVGYAEAAGAAAAYKDDPVRLQREWITGAALRYRLARAYAEAGR